MTKVTPVPGDWVRFVQGQKLVTGVVEYVQRVSWYPNAEHAWTDVGVVALDAILEVRSAAPREGR